MSSNHRSMAFFQNAALILIATVIAGVVFILDINTEKSVAVASIYSMVILYSWLLPGKYSSIIAAIVCTFLTIISAVHGKEIVENPTEISKVNVVISLVVIWISVILVLIAKSSFSSLELINKRLSENSEALLQTVKELDLQKQALSENQVQLENLNEDLLTKNRELERFTSIASHDLQEPLRTIGNMTLLINKRYYMHFDDQGKKILEYVTQATDRMTKLIKGLLDFSRIGNKREIQTVDCQELVKNIVLDFDAALKTLNGKVTVNPLPEIQGASIELRILFQNLISNGLKYRKSDVSPVITVSSKDIGAYVEFCVSDNGIGIEEADFEKIFLIFQRLHSAEEYEGTGLGLAYCRKIVELHGGKIWLESKKGIGTSFYFTLEKTYERNT